MPYPRPPTEEEWRALSNIFPALDRGSVLVTGGATRDYNCIAWALGYVDRWINPPPGLPAFNALFLGPSPRGYTQVLPPLSGDATADGYGLAPTNMTHASRLDEVWSSKLGQSLRITHNRDGLDGRVYGQVLQSYNSE